MKECLRGVGLLVPPCVWALSTSALAGGPGYGDAWEDYYPYWYESDAYAFPYRNLLNFHYRDGSISKHFAHPREDGKADVTPLRSLYGIRRRPTDSRRPVAKGRYQVNYRRDYRKNYRVNYRRGD